MNLETCLQMLIKVNKDADADKGKESDIIRIIRDTFIN